MLTIMKKVMQAFPYETYLHIYQFFDRPSKGTMWLTYFSNFQYGKYPWSHLELFHFCSFQRLCGDILIFKQTGRFNVSTGYAGIESMSVPISCTKDDLDWDQFYQAMEWIKVKILDVQVFFFQLSKLLGEVRQLADAVMSNCVFRPWWVYNSNGNWETCCHFSIRKPGKCERWDNSLQSLHIDITTASGFFKRAWV
jgi:hypothetical protein